MLYLRPLWGLKQAETPHQPLLQILGWVPGICIFNKSLRLFK